MPAAERFLHHVKCDFWAASLNLHHETQYNIYKSQVILQDLLVDINPVVYQAHQTVFGTFECPNLGCIVKAKTRYILRQHFQVLHPQDLVNIAGEGFFPQCGRYGIQVNPTATRHCSTPKSNRWGKRGRCRARLEQAWQLLYISGSLHMGKRWKG